MIKGRNILAVLAVFLSLACTYAPVAYAQIGRDSDLTDDHMDKAEAAYEKGQFDLATQHFSRALRAEDVDDKTVARILYRRGAAFERAGKPAQAIADLTKALYLPSLSTADRAKAYLSRGRAYESVGLGDRARSDIAKARSGGVDERTIARSSAPPPQSVAGGGSTSFTTVSEASSGRSGSIPSFSTSSEASGNATPSFRTSSARAPAPPPSFETSSSAPQAQRSRQQVASFDTRSRSARSRDDELPQFRTTILPDSSGSQSASSSGQAEQEEESGGTVKRFIGNLWSNATGSEKKEQEASPPATPQWSQQTQTARAPAPTWTSQSSSSVAAAPPAATTSLASPSPAAGANGYRIQLAALKTDAEAQTTWNRLKSRHGNLLGGHQPNIVRTELGGLGTFYRLQLGPFADKEQSKQLCQQFKAGGLDCFLLAP